MTAIAWNAAFNQPFLLVSSEDHVSGILGATPTVLIAKVGGVFNPIAGTVSEIGYGWYNISLTAADTNTLGMVSFHCTAPGADDTDFNALVTGLSV